MKKSIISIHAPRVGSDAQQEGFFCPFVCISIHAPRVGSDLYLKAGFYGERISIHAPRVGSDSKIAQFFACNFAQK